MSSTIFLPLGPVFALPLRAPADSHAANDPRYAPSQA